MRRYTLAGLMLLVALVAVAVAAVANARGTVRFSARFAGVPPDDRPKVPTPFDVPKETVPIHYLADMEEFERRWVGDAEAMAIMTEATYEALRGKDLPMRLLDRDGRRVIVARH